jgi:hypothetical protein
VPVGIGFFRPLILIGGTMDDFLKQNRPAISSW